MAGSYGYATALALDADGTFSSGAKRYEFIGDVSLGMSTVIVDSNGTRGERSRNASRIAQGIKTIDGGFTIEPNPVELDFLLPFILGGTEGSSDDFAVADALPSLSAMVDRVAKVHTYAGLKVARAVFSASTNQKLTLSLDFMGLTEAEGEAGSFQSGLTIDATLPPYILHQGVLSLGGTEREFQSFELVIDNQLIAVHNNSQTPSYVDPQDRIVTLAVDTPYHSNTTALYTGNVTDASGLAGFLTFTIGSRSTRFDLGNLKVPQNRTPSAGTKNEIRLTTQYQAYKTGSTAEIKITNDSTGA